MAHYRTVFGAELPRLLHHQFFDYGKPPGTFHQAIGMRPWVNKPEGGFWAHPVTGLPAGKWRPIPRRSAWTDWCEVEMPEWINFHTQTEVFPQPDALFALIDSREDAARLQEVFDASDHPVHAIHADQFAKTLGGTGTRLPGGPQIDFSRLAERNLSGVYLTEKGERETRFPLSLYGWDMTTVWFCEPAYRLGTTWRSEFVGEPPYETLAQARRRRKRERQALKAGISGQASGEW